MQRAAKFNSSPNLYQAQNHASLRILSILGGWGVRRSFNQMGIHVGDEVRVLSRAPFGGPLLIESRGTRVAIGKQLAEKIKVEIIP